MTVYDNYNDRERHSNNSGHSNTDVDNDYWFNLR